MNLRQILTDIYEQEQELTPPLLVDKARDVNHPLHHRFEWDDRIAGEAYRLVQAQELIRSVKVTFTTTPDGEPLNVRAFHAVARPQGSTYMPLDEIAEDPFTAQLVTRAAEREWRQFYRKYGHLVEVIKMIQREVA